MCRFAVFATVLFACIAPPVLAGPRDELLRVAPPDAALLVVVQNAREHVKNLADSPFVAWLPSTSLGKKLLDSAEFKQLRESAALFTELGTTPQAVLDDIVGDVVAFAYSPAPAGKPDAEQAVVLIRPRKPEALAKVIDRFNELQTKAGEIKAVARREHAGAAYFARQHLDGAAEFYCFRGDVFAFSSSEADIKAFIDRDKAAPVGKVPALVARLTQLGVADSALVMLVNPRSLDAEVNAKASSAKPDDKRFLTKFAEVWTGLDAAAVYMNLGKELEVGLSLRFNPDKLPADAKKWLALTQKWESPERLIPRDALFGFAGHVRAADLLEVVASLAPIPAGKPGVKEWIAQTVGPIVGRDNLPLVLDSLGPNWAVWAEAPAKDTKDAFLPTLVAAVEVSGESRAKAEKSLLQTVEFGFQTARVAYNGRHTDQIELKETKDAAGLTITTLVNDKGFPPGFRPSFALTQGYLVIATSPDAIRRFTPPAAGAALPKGDITLATLSGIRTREYLQTHGAKLAAILAELGVGEAKAVRTHLEDIAGVLELIDTATVIARPTENGLRIAVRVKPAKPLLK